MKLFKSVLFVLGIVPFAAGVLIAGDLTPASLVIDEQKALEAEGREDLDLAREYFSKGLTTLLTEYPKRAGKEQHLIGGIAEAYLHKLVNLYYKDYQYKAAVKFLEEVKVKPVPPALDPWLKYYLGDLYLKTNNVPKARQQYNNLGFINQWQIIGPFDNENGAGFDTVYPPETETDLKAVYEGKKIQVAFRPINLEAVQGGYLDFSAYLRPDKNAIGYSLVYVFSEQDQPVAFRIASDEGIKLYLNKTLLHSADIHRKLCTIDQDVVGGKLTKGWNEILLKVATTRWGWGCRLRITAPDGTSIKTLKYQIDIPSDIAKSGEKVKLPEDDLHYLTQTAEQFPEEPRYNFYLGLVHTARAGFDTQNPLDRWAFQKAALTSFNPADYLYYYAQTRREETSPVEREENEYRLALERVIAARPAHLVALVDLAEYYLYSLRNKIKCRDYLERVIKQRKEKIKSASYLETKLLQAEGYQTEADLRLEALAKEEPDYLPALLDYVTKLREDGRLDEARQICQHILQDIDYTNQIARANLVDILSRQGETERALQLHLVAGWLNPNTIDSCLARARIMAGRDDYTSALEEVRRALVICPLDENALSLAGQYLRFLGKTSEAIESWHKAIAVNPNYIWLQRYLEWVESTGASFETPYRYKLEDILSACAISNTFPAQYLLNQTVVKLNKDGTSRQYVHQIIRILSEKGRERFQQISLPYYPEKQRVKILTARVIYPDKRRLDAVYTGGASLNLPPLELHSVIDLEYRRDDISQGFFGDYFGDTFYFASELPSAKSSYIVITPPEKKVYFHTRNITIEPRLVKDDTQDAYFWEAENLAGFSPEPLMPPLKEIAPTLQVSTYPPGAAGWQEFGRWYWHLIKRQYDFSDQMRDALKRWTHPLMTSEDKVKSVYYIVIGEIRYVAWEYGIHGWKPYRASTIFTRKFGDCKDKATLINVFLKEIGIKSSPVLIYADEVKGKDDLTLPMVEHFNHCIALATLANGKEIYLDGTAVFNAPGTIPAEDTESKVFVLNESGGEIKQTPTLKPDNNLRQEINALRLTKKGDARLETTQTFTGTRAGELRYSLSNPARRGLVLERMFGQRYGGTKIIRVQSSPLADLETPATIAVTADIPDFLATAGQGYSFKPVLFPRDLAGWVNQSRRKFDLLLPITEVPCEDRIQTEIILPAKAEVKSLPENVDIDNKFGMFNLNYKIQDSRIIFTEVVSFKARRIAPEDYPAFRDFCNRISREEAREIIITYK